MSFDTIRINELAKELKLTSKEVIEKLAQISITGKTHSSTLTVDQVRRLKDFINAGSVKEVKKPKAFIVKKAKVSEPEQTPKEEKKEEEPKKTLIERPKVEVVRPQSRLEIVRRAPRPAVKPEGERPERPPFRKEDGKKFPPRQQGDKSERPKKPFPPRDGQQSKPTDGKRPERPVSGVKNLLNAILFLRKYMSQKALPKNVRIVKRKIKNLIKKKNRKEFH